MEIRYIKGEEIDKSKWNSCIYYAHNGNIFGYHWFLTNVVKEWDAIVEGDYETVLPLIYEPSTFFSRSKLRLHPLLRSTGIYSVHVLSEKRIEKILEHIPSKFQRGKIRINEGMKIPAGLIWKQLEEKSNALFLLQNSYEELTQNYRPILNQKLERARLANLYAVNNLKPETLVDFYKANNPNWTEKNYHAYLRIMYNALHRGWGFLSGVQNPQQELLAANFFMISNQRLMSLLPLSNAKGEKTGALEYLFDLSIKIQAGKPLMLDFNVDKFGSFEKQFGAIESPFSVIGR